MTASRLRWKNLARLCIAALALLMAAFNAGCDGRSVYSGKVILGETHVFGAGDVVDGDLVVTGGTVTLQEGSLVTGSMYMFGGSVEAGGEVADNVTMLGGRLAVGGTANIGGQLRIGGTDATVSPNAAILGGVQTVPGVGVPPLQEEGGQSPVRRVLQSLLPAFILALVAYVWVRVMPGPVGRVSTVVVRYPVVAAAAGLLAGVVALMLLVLMAYTIILIPVSLAGIGLLAIAAVYGWIAIGLATGKFIAERLRWRLSFAVMALIGTLAFMIVLTLIGLIPYLGSAVVGLAVVIGFGAVFLTRLGRWEYAPQSEE